MKIHVKRIGRESPRVAPQLSERPGPVALDDEAAVEDRVRTVLPAQPKLHVRGGRQVREVEVEAQPYDVRRLLRPREHRGLHPLPLLLLLVLRVRRRTVREAPAVEAAHDHLGHPLHRLPEGVVRAQEDARRVLARLPEQRVRAARVPALVGRALAPRARLGAREEFGDVEDVAADRDPEAVGGRVRRELCLCWRKL